MPNHVINRITITGDPQILKKMLNAIQNDEVGFGSIDFNKIIPMPDSLNIEAGTGTDKGLRAYRDFIQETYTAPFAPDIIDSKDEESFLSKNPEITPRQWALGKAAYENLRKYGVPTWYEWAIHHWGTKWNAYESIPGAIEGDHVKLSFQTAWSAPYPILQKLSEEYPSLAFSHLWADEDIGVNCGKIEYENSHVIEEYCPEGREAALFACAVWEPKVNEQNTQIYAEKPFDVVELLGRTALFTSARVKPETLPDGLYKYDLREGESIYFASIEPSVVVNHAGTIITKDPIDFGEDGYIALDDDSSPNFLGEWMTLEEFADSDPVEIEEQAMGGMAL